MGRERTLTDSSGPTYADLWQFIIQRMMILAKADPGYKETAAWTAFRGLADEHVRAWAGVPFGPGVPERLREDLLNYVRTYLPLTVRAA